jgi:hypothetical protein
LLTGFPLAYAYGKTTLAVMTLLLAAGGPNASKQTARATTDDRRVLGD